MESTAHPFTYIVSLAAVVNGLGIVRLLTAFSEYLKARHKLEVLHYWVFYLFAGLQLLLHIFFWWSLWSFRDVESFNFLQYIYLLSGPTLLFLASSLLAPGLDEETVDLRETYFNGRRTFFTVMSLVWLWGLLLRPMISGVFTPAWPLFALFLVSSLTLRMTDHRATHATVVILQWLLLIVFIGAYGMQLGFFPGSQG